MRGAGSSWPAASEQRPWVCGLVACSEPYSPTDESFPRQVQAFNLPVGNSILELLRSIDWLNVQVQYVKKVRVCPLPSLRRDFISLIDLKLLMNYLPWFRGPSRHCSYNSSASVQNGISWSEPWSGGIEIFNTKQALPATSVGYHEILNGVYRTPAAARSGIEAQET